MSVLHPRRHLLRSLYCVKEHYLDPKVLQADALSERAAARMERPLTGMVMLVSHAIVTGALVGAWTHAVPVLIRPRFTWLGAPALPESAYAPLQAQGDLVIVVAAIASLIRVARTTHAGVLPADAGGPRLRSARQGAGSHGRQCSTAR